MNPHYTYLLLDLGTLLFPLALSFDKKVAFHRWLKPLFWPWLFTALFFLVWDGLFTRNGVWGFNDAYILGPKVAGMPLEELLFFFVVPYACVFIYACLQSWFASLRRPGKGWYALLIIGFVLMVLAGSFHDRAYTFTAFGFCGFACFMLFLLRRWFPDFYPHTFLLSWLISLVPFFLVNGVLTALPVVIYNDAENLGIRLYTIPLEDTFYGMLLVLLVAAASGWRGKRIARR